MGVRPHNPRFQHREIKPQKPLTENTCGVEAAVGETPILTGEFIDETHWVLECTQNHPPGNWSQKGPVCLWVAQEMIECRQRAEQAALFPLRPLPHIQCHNASGLPRPGEHLRLCPVEHNKHAETKNMA